MLCRLELIYWQLDEFKIKEKVFFLIQVNYPKLDKIFAGCLNQWASGFVSRFTTTTQVSYDF